MYILNPNTTIHIKQHKNNVINDKSHSQDQYIKKISPVGD